MDRLAATIAGYSLDVRPGEVTIVSGPPSAEPLMARLFAALVERGSLPVLRLSTDICYDATLRSETDVRERYVNPFGVADGAAISCSVGIWTYDSRETPEATDDVLAPPSHVDRTLWRCSAWPASARLRWTVALYPTISGAAQAGMRLSEFEDLVVRSAFLDSPWPAESWRRLHEQHSRLCDQLSRADVIRVVTPRGTDLALNVAGRRWISGDGHFNLPDGEVFTSPCEDSAAGMLVADFPILHNSQWIDGVRLKFRDGRVVDASAREGERHLLELLSSDHGACRIGEIGIGTNPRLRNGTGLSLLDEKIAGTVHIGLGASHPATGCTNRSMIHRDLVTDPRRTGRLDVDGRPLLVPVVGPLKAARTGPG